MHLAKLRHGALAATVIAVASLVGPLPAPSWTVARAAGTVRPGVALAAGRGVALAVGAAHRGVALAARTAHPGVALAAAVREPLARAADGRRVPAPVAGTWRAPVDGMLLRPFRVLPGRFVAGQHRGVDLAAPPGTPVRAACGGRVRFAGRVPGGGLTLSIGCGAVVATYQQLGTIAVERGEAVARGRRIATVGHARPRPHLHLGARLAVTGAYLDPLRLLARTPRGAPPVAPGAPVRVTVPERRRGPRPPVLARAPRLGRAPSPAAPKLGRAPSLGHAPSPGRAPGHGPPPAPTRAPHPGLATSRAGFAGGFGSSTSRRAAPLVPSSPTSDGPSAGWEDRPAAGSPSTEPISAPLPWSVWLGLALFGLGLPIRGLLVRRRRARLRAVAKAAS